MEFRSKRLLSFFFVVVVVNVMFVSLRVSIRLTLCVLTKNVWERPWYGFFRSSKALLPKTFPCQVPLPRPGIRLARIDNFHSLEQQIFPVFLYSDFDRKGPYTNINKLLHRPKNFPQNRHENSTLYTINLYFFSLKQMIPEKHIHISV